MLALPAIHTFLLVSRSGRVAATLGRVDLDDEEDAGRTREEVARGIAAIAHPPLNEAGRHQELAQVVAATLEMCETRPGAAKADTIMRDGRTVVVRRSIASDVQEHGGTP